MKKASIIIFFCFTSLISLAQGSKITVSGKVIDNETSEPLVFATIGIKGKPIGTITNSQGEFDFHFPSSYSNDMLSITMLGYDNYDIPVRDVINQGFITVKMEKAVQLLDEVVIRDSLSPGDITTIAINRIEENYPMDAYLMDGFYRDIKKVGGRYVSLLEAAIKIFDRDYRAPRNENRLRERVSLVEIRRSLGYDHKFTKYFDQSNLLEDLLLKNDVKYRSFPDDPTFYDNLQRLKDTYYDNKPVYVIELNGGYHIRLYIAKADYSILRMEFESKLQTDLGVRKNLNSKFFSQKKTLDFKEVDGIMFLNFMRVESKIQWYHLNTGELAFETELFQELLVNQVYPNTSERIGTVEKMKKYGLQYQDQEYNKDFWENYNVIKESPLDKIILRDLEAELSLEDQFEGN